MTKGLLKMQKIVKKEIIKKILQRLAPDLAADDNLKIYSNMKQIDDPAIFFAFEIFDFDSDVLTPRFRINPNHKR